MIKYRFYELLYRISSASEMPNVASMKAVAERIQNIKNIDRRAKEASRKEMFDFFFRERVIKSILKVANEGHTSVMVFCGHKTVPFGNEYGSYKMSPSRELVTELQDAGYKVPYSSYEYIEINWT